MLALSALHVGTGVVQCISQFQCVVFTEKLLLNFWIFDPGYQDLNDPLIMVGICLKLALYHLRFAVSEKSWTDSLSPCLKR